MMKREKDIRRPKKGFKLFIVQCGQCQKRQMVELKKHQKSIKHKCVRCLTTNRHRIVGKIKKMYVKWNMSRIKWF